MSKYVDVENISVSDCAEIWECYCTEDGPRIVTPVDDLRYLPEADVAPVVHGKWEHDHVDMVGGNFAVVRCSICSYKAYAIADHVRNGNYCPSCGAKMDLEGIVK